jgi:mono/diheme cytochrome c family protein
LCAVREWKREAPGRAAFLSSLAKCVGTEGRPKRTGELLELAESRHDEIWQTGALLDGLLASAPAPTKSVNPYKKRIRFAAEPGVWKSLREAGPDIATRMIKLEQFLTWPGLPGYEAPPPVRPLTPSESRLFDTGRDLYAATCAACHQPTGLGLEGQAPPLVDSEWVLGPEGRLGRIVLHGLRGPLSVKGRVYDGLEMPALGTLSDGELAAILTYIRREWEHGADPIMPGTISSIRSAAAKRQEGWTEGELLKVK